MWDANKVSVNNRSSVRHNIITHQENRNSGPITQTHGITKKLLFKKKAVGEFGDERRVSAIHHNIDYRRNYSQDKNIFKKLSNLCSATYDSAHRLSLHPFKLEK